MFWQSVWRDRSWRMLPIWLVFTALNTSVLMGVVIMRTVRNEASEYPQWQLLLILWWAVIVFFAASNIRDRCSRLDLALPIPARRLWTSHFAAVTLAGLTVLGASLGMLVLHQEVLSRVPDSRMPPLDLAALFGPMAGGLLLLTALLLAYRPRLWRVQGWRYWLVLLACVVACTAMSLALASRPWLGTLLPFYLAFVVAYLVVRSLPEAFALVPRAAQASAAKEGTLESTGDSMGKRRPAAASLFQILHHAPPWGVASAWVLYLFVALIGFFMGGGLDSVFETDDLRFMYIPLSVYMLFTPIGIIMFHIYKVDPLPVSRKRVFALLTLPTLISFIASFALGQFMSTARPGDKRFYSQNVLVKYRVAREMRWVDVDPKFMSISWDGHLPQLTSPSGESHRVWSVPVIQSLPISLYSSFNTAEESSWEFEAWLMSQAIEKVHGVNLTAEEVIDAAFVVTEEGIVGSKGDFALYENHPELWQRQAQTSPEVPVGLALIVVPWLLLLALYFRTFRAGSSVKRAKVVYWGALGVLLAIILIQAAGMIAGWYDIYAARGVLAASIYQLGSSPSLHALTWIVCLTAAAAAYLLAQGVFRQSELPATPVKFTLIDFSREDD